MALKLGVLCELYFYFGRDINGKRLFKKRISLIPLH